MIVKDIEVINYRNYKRQKVCFSNDMNIIYGENAQGKTNLLEAVFLLSGNRSWRTSKKTELLLFGENEGLIKAHIFSRNRDFTVELFISSQKKSTAFINKIKIKRKYDLSDVTKCILFSPEDLTLVKGPSSMRRGFMDQALCQLDGRYDEALNIYNRILEQKNRVLKSGERRSELIGILPEYNSELIKTGAVILKKRAEYCNILDKKSAEIYSLASDGKEKMNIVYQTVSSVTDLYAPEEQIIRQLTAHMQSHYEAELASESCLSGIHKDDISINIDSMNARSFASQGQARTAVIAMKFGERELFKNQTGEYPVLLLDDVLSELDSFRKDFVAGYISQGQTIITSCENPGNFISAAFLKVSGGKVLEQ